MKRHIGTAVVCLLSVHALGCTEFLGLEETPPPNDAPDASTPNGGDALCATLAPMSLSGQPLDALPLGTRELTREERDNLWFEFEYASQWYPGVIEGDLDPQLIVPIHPEGIAGGTLRIRFIDGLADSTCDGATPPTIELTVDALTPAAGELARFEDAYVGFIEVFASSQGLDFQELRDGSIEDVPVHFLPALVGWGAIADPANPNRLGEVVRPNGPWSDLEDLSSGLELAEALMAKAGAVAALEDATAKLSTFEAPSEPIALERVLVTPTALDPAGLTAASLFRIEIDNAAELSYWMRYARKAHAFEFASNQVNTIATYLGVVPQLTAATNVVGFATVGFSQLAHAVESLVPTTIKPKSATFSPETYFEDQERIGRVTEYTIEAESGRWKFTQAMSEILIEIIFAKIDSVEGPKAGRTVENVAGKETLKDRTKELTKENFRNLGKVELLNQLKSETKSLFDSLEGAYIGPFTWGPFDLGGTTAMYLSIDSTAIRETATPGGYESLGFGTALAQVQVKATEFPPLSNEESSRISRLLEVLPIEVSIEPLTAYVVPGEVVTLEMFVKNAVDPSLEVEVDGGRVQVISDTRVELTIPADAKQDDIITVRVSSASTSGLRAPEFRDGPRSATAHFFLKQRITLSPSYTCIQPGDSLDLNAEVLSGDPNPQLDWETTGGVLLVSDDTHSAAFIAPSELGFFEVNATLRSDREVVDSAIVQVGDCGCFFDGRINGVAKLVGPNVSSIESGGIETFFGDWPNGESSTAFTAFSSDVPDRYGLFITTDSRDTFLTGDDGAAVLTGRSTVDGFVEGTFTGQVHNALDADDPPASFEVVLRFRGVANATSGASCLDSRD